MARVCHQSGALHLTCSCGVYLAARKSVRVSNRVSVTSAAPFLQISNSAYEPGKDTAEKVVEVLQCSHLTQAEHAIYTSDFNEFDLDGDGFLSRDEVKAMFQKQLERDPTEQEVTTFLEAFDTNHDGKVSLDEYIGRLCGKFDIVGLTDEEAKAGFLEELKKVPVAVARAGLKEADYKDKAEELEKLSDAEVMDAYIKMSLEVFENMPDDASAQGEMLGDVLSKLDEKSADAEKVKELVEAVKADADK